MGLLGLLLRTQSDVLGAGFGSNNLLPLMSCCPVSSLMMYDSPSGLLLSTSASVSQRPVL